MIEHILAVLKSAAPDDTLRQSFFNNLSGKLLYTIDAPVTEFQIAVVSGSWPIFLPAGVWFNVTFSSPIDGRFEIVRVVAMNNDYLSVERGRQGTLPQLWEAATTILSARLDANTINRMARKDELNRWTMTQEFKQGFLNRGDARFVDGLSIGGDGTEPDATIGTVNGMVSINAGIPLALNSTQMQINGIGFPANPALVEGQHLYVDKTTHQIVGRRLEWYIGAFISAPAHLNNGDPMQPGMIYFNLISLRPLVWTGARWRDLITPGSGFLKQLVYVVDSAAQTEFPLGDPDLNGNVYELDLVNPETLHVFLNGVLLVENVGFGGDFIVNVALNKLTLTQGTPVGSTLQIDMSINPVKLSPVGAEMSMLTPPVPNGTTTTFDLTLIESGDSISPGGPQDLEIYVDGVRQRPGFDYDVVLDQMTFTTAPHATAVVWGLYYLPFTAAPAGAGLPAGNQEGDTLQTNADLEWIAKQNVDAGTA